MPYDKEEHHRRSIRLAGYDYTSTGAYFVTICVHRGECSLGKVVGGEMQLSAWGQIAHAEWLLSEVIRRELRLDAFVVMPNHLHGIVWIDQQDQADGAVKDSDGKANMGAHGHDTASVAALGQGTPCVRAHGRAPRRAPKSLGSFVAGYKSVVTQTVSKLRNMPGEPLWQRNYWEHIIRDQADLDRIREYIENNPARWADDQLHPDAPPNPFNQWHP